MKLWTVKEIIELTGFSERTVARAISRGELQSTKIGSSRRVKHEWLVGWLGFDPLEGNSAITIKKTARKGDQETTTVTEMGRAESGS